MLKDIDGKRTMLQPGDEMIINTDTGMVTIIRDSRPLTIENKNEVDCTAYWLIPKKGKQYSELAKLIADVSGLSFEELMGFSYPTFRFLFID